MVRVDAKGRIVLPQDLRERLGITPGSEVEIREEGGAAVVEPEDDPDAIIADLSELVSAAAGRREQTDYEDLSPEARDHVETIRRGADSVDE